MTNNELMGFRIRRFTFKMRSTEKIIKNTIKKYEKKSLRLFLFSSISKLLIEQEQKTTSLNDCSIIELIKLCDREAQSMLSLYTVLFSLYRSEYKKNTWFDSRIFPMPLEVGFISFRYWK